MKKSFPSGKLIVSSLIHLENKKEQIVCSFCWIMLLYFSVFSCFGVYFISLDKGASILEYMFESPILESVFLILVIVIAVAV